ncbi:MAG: family transcriptional regulator, cyclic receptor protein [Pyrinomonadaceae bacterium]|nr:family transcriptional regulator, cyclic receptor protein [Pyrinomonadaceae bacterium]
MASPDGLKTVENCAACRAAATQHFCALGEDALRQLDGIKFALAYAKGARIFVEGQEARGVYLLCAGRVKLSTSSGDARVLITQIVEPGEMLGLGAALSGEPYEVTAETLEPSEITFVRRAQFLRLLSENRDAALRAARQMSRNYRAAFEQVRLLGLSQTAAAKLARFLLAEARAHEGHENGAGCSRMKLTLTHEEIGQRIGASRETVTRIFSEFKQERIIQVKGSTLLVHDRAALEVLISY